MRPSKSPFRLDSKSSLFKNSNQVLRFRLPKSRGNVVTKIDFSGSNSNKMLCFLTVQNHQDWRWPAHTRSILWLRFSPRDAIMMLEIPAVLVALSLFPPTATIVARLYRVDVLLVRHWQVHVFPPAGIGFIWYFSFFVSSFFPLGTST